MFRFARAAQTAIRAAPHRATLPALPQRAPAERHQRLIGNEAMGLLARSARIDVALGGPSQPLPPPLRAEMEGRFGADFSAVRVHAGPDAAASAEAMGAQAFTVGRDIVFGTGRFAPETTAGRELLAHELAHVIQQSRGGPSPEGDAGLSLEQDAARAAEEPAGAVQVEGASGVGLARQPDAEAEILRRQRATQIELAARGITLPSALLPPSAAAPPPRTIWLGRPRPDVQLEQRRTQRQELAELRKTDPGALPPPVWRPGSPSAQTLLGFDPLQSPLTSQPTRFETLLHSNRLFEIDLGKGHYTIAPSDVVPVFTAKSHKIAGYAIHSGQFGETVFTVNRAGEVVESRGTEAPVQSDPIQPAEILLDLVPLVGPTAALARRGLTSLAEATLEAGGSIVRREVLRGGLRAPLLDTGELALEEGLGAAGQGLRLRPPSLLAGERERGFRFVVSGGRPTLVLGEGAPRLGFAGPGELPPLSPARRVLSGRSLEALARLDPVAPPSTVGAAALNDPTVFTSVGEFRLVSRPATEAMEQQALWSGRPYFYRGNNIRVTEFRTLGVDFDAAIVDEAGSLRSLEEFKSSYAGAIARGDVNVANRLRSQALSQIRIAGYHGVPLRWHVPELQLPMFQNALGPWRTRRITWAPYVLSLP